MSAQPVEAHGPSDPAAILISLPHRLRNEFLAQYRQAAQEAAADVGAFAELTALLDQWDRRARLYASPSFRAARAAAAAPSADDVPFAELDAERRAG